ncbi:hypothetical protein FVEN_g10173 [Fusarium venenatum]|uniref:Glycosyl transferase family 1 domain-containing protein n=1 Tax=Fusarium venenatum TaxID=56646 RepID=A0A2L2T9U1_9HYPO|nr:uncharacterized protein FVRRES_03141 [Fusarium venenatum]KAG8351777.1 hypothetical protein FVEN_g10173 [Fusarium venenatum]KAH7003809.1 hypothetical protein EDB82DRAFT_33506 [Fusarium venenatum]CEI66629.1 unnamed protein product [Fusarium venenatum]
MAVALPRRFYSLLWVAILLALVVFFVFLREDTWSSIPRPPNGWKIPFTTDDGVLSSWMGNSKKAPAKDPNEPLRIVLTESSGTHDEVAAALMHAFGGQEGSQLDVYFANQRFQMQDIMGNFSLPANITINKWDKFASAVTENPPHILVSTTCEFDLDRGADPIVKLLKTASTHLFCTIHHADRWAQGKYVQAVRSFAEHQRVDFVGLSQHTVDFFLNDTIPKWHTAANLTTRVIPPVFPVQIPDPDLQPGISLSLQGDYSSGRRDYNGIFNHLGSVVRKAGEEAEGHSPKNVSLHVIGHGTPPEVPDHVKDHVHFDQGLSYPDFYTLLSKSFALLPAFASDTYFDRKASSTIPASLIAGAPIVATEELLKAYSYMPREATWLARPGEGEMDVIERVIDDRDGFLKRRQAVRDLTKKLLEDNHANTKAWIEEAFERYNNN